MERTPQASHGQTRPKYQDLEILRACAALVVVLSHLVQFGLIGTNFYISFICSFSTEAVMMFFVLSGAIITFSHKPGPPEQRPVEFWKFIRARLVRILPIYYVALALAAIAQIATRQPIDGVLYVKNIFFLQSLTGVAAPPTNAPLWSLPLEMAYYLLFAFSLLRPRLIYLWMAAAVVFTVAVYPPPKTSPASVRDSALAVALSLPWLFGHWTAVLKSKAPPIPRSLGLAIFVIGLTYSCMSIQNVFYDIARLSAFSLCCCPLVLSILQGPPRPTERNYWLLRTALAAGAVGLLWLTSSSQPMVKVVMTMTAVASAVSPLRVVDLCLRLLRPVAPAFVYAGSISYALYAIHTPLVFLLKDLPAPLPVKVAMFAAILWLAAHVLERLMQPAIRRRLTAWPARVPVADVAP